MNERARAIATGLLTLAISTAACAPARSQSTPDTKNNNPTQNPNALKVVGLDPNFTGRLGYQIDCPQPCTLIPLPGQDEIMTGAGMYLWVSNAPQESGFNLDNFAQNYLAGAKVEGKATNVKRVTILGGVDARRISIRSNTNTLTQQEEEGLIFAAKGKKWIIRFEQSSLGIDKKMPVIDKSLDSLKVF